MTKRTKGLLSGIVLAASIGCSGLVATAATGTDNEQLALEMATLFRAARAVISANQALINDPDKGDKGLSGDHAVDLAKANYEKAVGHPLPAADPATAAGQAQIAQVLPAGIRPTGATIPPSITSSLPTMPTTAIWTSSRGRTCTTWK